MLQDAENTTVSSRSLADQPAAQATQASPASTDLEPPTEFEPAASGEPATDGMGIANQQSIDTSLPLPPSSAPLEIGPEPGLDPVEYPEFPPAAAPDDLQPAAVEEDDNRGVRRARRHPHIQLVLVVRVVDTVDVVDVPVDGCPGLARCRRRRECEQEPTQDRESERGLSLIHI